jgi:hypothetical protein
MNELDPDIALMLNALSEAGLGRLARDAMANATEEDDSDGDTDSDEPGRREMSDRPREEQLLRADDVIIFALKNEIMAMDGIGESRRSLRIDSVLVVGDDVRAPDDLTSPQRREALDNLLTTWIEASNGLRQSWGSGYDA